jgi:hypothetical protein
MGTHSDLDYRLTVRFESGEHAHRLFSTLKTHSAAALATSRLDEGLVAEHDGEWLRIYAPTPDVLTRGQAIIAEVLELEGLRAEEQAEHRTPEDGEWELSELPQPPAQDAALITEHHGRGPWGSETEQERAQVHFELASRHDAQAFAAELANDGYDVHQAETFIYILTDNETQAHQLAEQLNARAPEGAQVFYEGEGRTIFI